MFLFCGVRQGGVDGSKDCVEWDGASKPAFPVRYAVGGLRFTVYVREYFRQFVYGEVGEFRRLSWSFLWVVVCVPAVVSGVGRRVWACDRVVVQ